MITFFFEINFLFKILYLKTNNTFQLNSKIKFQNLSQTTVKLTSKRAKLLKQQRNGISNNKELIFFNLKQLKDVEQAV